MEKKLGENFGGKEIGEVLGNVNLDSSEAEGFSFPASSLNTIHNYTNITLPPLSSLWAQQLVCVQYWPGKFEFSLLFLYVIFNDLETTWYLVYLWYFLIGFLTSENKITGLKGVTCPELWER